MTNRKHFMLLVYVVMLLLATLCQGQSTTVTLNVADTDGQTWGNGAWSVELYSPPGVPNSRYVIAGGTTPVPNQTQTGLLNPSGSAPVTLTPSGNIVPAGTQWKFQICPQATAPCVSQAFTIVGTTQTIALTLPALRISVRNPTVRVAAYLDIEVIDGSLGSSYFNLVDGTIHICTATTNGLCVFVTGSGLTNPTAFPGGFVANGTGGFNATAPGLYGPPDPYCANEAKTGTFDLWICDLQNVGPIYNSGITSASLAFFLTKIQMTGYSDGQLVTYHSAANDFEPPTGTTVTDTGVTTNSLSLTGALAYADKVVGSLPSAAGAIGQSYKVHDSTAVASEGQTCVGGSTNTALAFSNGTVWKCF